jgi:hypothetical protein
MLIDRITSTKTAIVVKVIPKRSSIDASAWLVPQSGRYIAPDRAKSRFLQNPA